MDSYGMGATGTGRNPASTASFTVARETRPHWGVPYGIFHRHGAPRHAGVSARRHKSWLAAKMMSAHKEDAATVTNTRVFLAVHTCDGASRSGPIFMPYTAYGCSVWLCLVLTRSPPAKFAPPKTANTPCGMGVGGTSQNCHTFTTGVGSRQQDSGKYYGQSSIISNHPPPLSPARPGRGASFRPGPRCDARPLESFGFGRRDDRHKRRSGCRQAQGPPLSEPHYR